MPGSCKVEISGYAGADAELRVMASGKKLCTWSVAVGKEKFVQWHRCQAWGETADMAANIKKGTYFKGNGTIQYNKYQDKVYTNIVIFELELNPRKSKQPKKIGDKVVIDGEEYEVVEDTGVDNMAEQLKDIPF